MRNEIVNRPVRTDDPADHETIEGVDLRPSFPNNAKTIRHCTFRNCTLRAASFYSARIYDCVFEDCNWEFPSGTTDVSDVFITGVDFYNCTLRRNIFNIPRIDSICFFGGEIDSCEFLPGIHVSGLRLVGIRGVWTCPSFEHVEFDERHADQIVRLNNDLREIPLDWRTRWTSWERIRTLGNLPLFGASYAALILIPVTLYLLSIYNMQVMRLSEWAERASLGDTVWIAALHPAPLPSLSLALLIGTFLLALASTLFAVCCPPRVREFSLERWTDEFRRPGLHYLVQSWKNPRTRLVCMACYVSGAGITGAILIVKLARAAEYIWTYSLQPWWSL